MDVGPAGRARALYGVGALVSLIVAVTFLTVGDGVEVAEATGLRRFVIEVGHSAVWVLLFAAFALAAARATWSRMSGRIATAAGIVYAVFLGAVFVWP